MAIPHLLVHEHKYGVGVVIRKDFIPARHVMADAPLRGAGDAPATKLRRSV